jgi:hypothetical protein
LSLPLPYEVTVEYGEPIMRLAGRYFFWRFIRRDWFLPFFLISVAVIMWRIFKEWHYLAVVLLALAYVLFVVIMARRTVRQSLARAGLLKNPVAAWRCSEESFAFRTENSSGEMRWEVISEVWRYPEVWLLFFGDYRYSVLPVTNFPPELLEFIAERVRAKGGRIA